MTSPKPASKGRRAAFSLLEVLAGSAVFFILLLVVAQIVGSTSSITGLSNKNQEADIRARSLFARMAVDLGRMLKRPDVDYAFLKNTGNDQMAFYSAVEGYYDVGATPGAVSLVGYRVADNGGFRNVQRMGKGLSWLSDSSNASPVVYLSRKIQDTWPSAVSPTTFDADYEEIATGVFRLELSYLLKSGVISDQPWDAAQGHTTIDGLRDVASIIVCIAVIDPNARVRINPADLVAMETQLADFSNGLKMGELEKSWRTVANDPVTLKKTGGTLRIHSRAFPVDGN